MYFTLQALNEDATLNNFINIGSVKFLKDQALTIILRLHQPDKNLRYVPEASTTLSLTLRKSDNTTVTIAGTFPFADDRSIIKFSMTAIEMTDVIGQAIIVDIVESGAGTSTALLQSGLQVIKVSGC